MDRAWDGERERQAGIAEAPESAPQAPETALAATVGNRALGDVLARSGAGILPGNAVHPDVVTLIARSRGSGHSLPGETRERVAAQIGDPLDDVRVHTDATADGLARSVDARAFTTGADIYFAAGEYQPHTDEGHRLLAHELTHVGQQRGMAQDGPMTVSQPGEPLEAEAEAVSRDAAG